MVIVCCSCFACSGAIELFRVTFCWPSLVSLLLEGTKGCCWVVHNVLWVKPVLQVHACLTSGELFGIALCFPNLAFLLMEKVSKVVVGWFRTSVSPVCAVIAQLYCWCIPYAVTSCNVVVWRLMTADFANSKPNCGYWLMPKIRLH